MIRINYMHELLAPKHLFGIPLLLWVALGLSPLLHAATLTVTTNSDTGDGSLRQVILQENPDLATTNWTDITNVPTLNLTNLRNEVIVPAPLSFHGFYRVKH